MSPYDSFDVPSYDERGASAQWTHLSGLEETNLELTQRAGEQKKNLHFFDGTLFTGSELHEQEEKTCRKKVELKIALKREQRATRWQREPAQLVPAAVHARLPVVRVGLSREHHTRALRKCCSVGELSLIIDTSIQQSLTR